MTDAPASVPASAVAEARRQAETRRGILFILSSPSGAGKSTISRRLLADDREFSFSISATTRAPRSRPVRGRQTPVASA